MAELDKPVYGSSSSYRQVQSKRCVCVAKEKTLIMIRTNS